MYLLYHATVYSQYLIGHVPSVFCLFEIGGTMQTEEVVPRAQSTGIDLALTDNNLQHHLHHHHSAQIKCPLAPLAHMAVKQEPQEEEERSRDTSTLR